MAVYTTIDNPELYFQTKLYTGNGGTLAITLDGDEDMQPDFVWSKPRVSGGHFLSDSIRGGTKVLQAAESNGEITRGSHIQSFDTDGYTLAGDGTTNNSGDATVSWNWKAGTTGSGTTGGSGTGKAYSYSVSTDAGFSIIAYVGNGTDNHQVSHHLGAVPKMFIMKNRSRDSRSWNVYHHTQTASNGALLNTTDAYGGDGSMLNNVEPTSVYVNLGDSSETNQNDDNHIMYAFAEKQGYSKFGKYTANANADGPFIYTGFKPAWLLLKASNNGSWNWRLSDSTRTTFNSSTFHNLFPTTNDAEVTNEKDVDYLSNGFKLKTAGNGVNGSGYEVIYMAFAESPFVNSNGVPNNAG